VRPKKRLLLYCSDEDQAERIGFVLWTCGYKVDRAPRDDAHMRDGFGRRADLVLVVAATATPVRAIAQWAEGTPVVAWTRGEPVDTSGWTAQEVVRDGSVAALLDAVRRHVARRKAAA